MLPSRILMVVLQFATNEDIPALVEMMGEFYAESNMPLDAEATTRAFQSLIEKPDFGSIWMDFKGVEPTGYVVLTVCFSMEFGGFDGHIDDLYVRPAFRRQGVAKRLIEAVLIECNDRDLESLTVEVAPENDAAKALYLNLGLQPRSDDREILTAHLNAIF